MTRRQDFDRAGAFSLVAGRITEALTPLGFSQTARGSRHAVWMHRTDIGWELVELGRRHSEPTELVFTCDAGCALQCVWNFVDIGFPEPKYGGDSHESVLIAPPNDYQWHLESGTPVESLNSTLIDALRKNAFPLFEKYKSFRSVYIDCLSMLERDDASFIGLRDLSIVALELGELQTAMAVLQRLARDQRETAVAVHVRRLREALHTRGLKVE